MFLVLCNPDDIAAIWVAASLRSRGLDVEIVGTGELGSALRWEVRVGDGGEIVGIDLADGRSLRSDQLTGVLNRLGQVPAVQLNRADDADRVYVEAELAALHLSWLHFLPCPVLNPARPGGLSGMHRSPLEWAHLAAKAGFLPEGHAGVPMSAVSARLIVVDDAVLGDTVDPATAAAAVALRSLSGERILGIDLTIDHRGASLVDANPFPDLRWGGPAFIDALAAAVSRPAPSPVKVQGLQPVAAGGRS